MVSYGFELRASTNSTYYIHMSYLKIAWEFIAHCTKIVFSRDTYRYMLIGVQTTESIIIGICVTTFIVCALYLPWYFVSSVMFLLYAIGCYQEGINVTGEQQMMKDAQMRAQVMARNILQDIGKQRHTWFN